MGAMVWVCLLLSSATTELVDEPYRIPADEWRYIEVSLRQQPALLAADVESRGGAGELRLALVRSEDLVRDKSGRPHGALAVTEPGPRGKLRFYVRTPGEYAVVVQNLDARKPADVRVRVWLDFSAGRGMEVTQLSPQRRMAVIVISLAVFFGIVTWSARRLLGNMRRNGSPSGEYGSR